MAVAESGLRLGYLGGRGVSDASAVAASGVIRLVGTGALVLMLTAAASLFAFHVLDREARRIASAAGLQAAAAARELPMERRERDASKFSLRMLSVAAADGTTISGPRITPIAPRSDLESFRDTPYFIDQGDARGEAYGGYVQLPGGRHAFVGVQLDAYRGGIAPALASIVASGVAVALVLFAYGYWNQRRTHGQLAEVIGTLERVSHGEFVEGLSESGKGDEWDHLRFHVNTASVRLRSLIQQLGSLADLVSHELGSAVGRVQQRIEKISQAQDVAAAHELAQTALTETSRVRGAVQALLELNSIKAGDTHRFVRLDLLQLVRDVLQMFASSAEDAGLTLESHLERAEILGERDLIVQLLANLIDNAIKYTPRAGTITVELHCKDAEVHLSVADTGPGIPPELRSTVLEPARRLDRDRDKPGFGYGLAVVDAVARRHGGSMHMPEVARGLRVDAIFPRYRSATRGWPRSSRSIRR